MSQVFSQLSDDVAGAVDRASASIVQVFGHHRPTAGVVVGPDLVASPTGAVPGDTASVRLPDGTVVEGAVLGHSSATGVAAIRVSGLSAPALPTAEEPKVGHLAVAVGRTWSGGVTAFVTNVAVVGGPLRTSRASQLDRVIRVALSPHGAITGGALIDGDGRALGLVSGYAIRGTTVVIPSSIAWATVTQLAQTGGTRQGFVGISSSTAALPERQRGGRSQNYGVLITGIVHDSPADAAGLLIGDVIVAFDGQQVQEPEELVTLLRGDRVGKSVPLTVLRGAESRDFAVTIGERPKRERRGDRHRG
jgi:S1-C subfamily serine protease